MDGVDARSVRRLGIQSVSVTGQTSVTTETNLDETGALSSSLSESVASESVPEASTEASSVVSEEPQERLVSMYVNKENKLMYKWKNGPINIENMIIK